MLIHIVTGKRKRWNPQDPSVGALPRYGPRCHCLQTEQLTERLFPRVHSNSIFVTISFKGACQFYSSNRSSNINSVAAKRQQFTVRQRSMARSVAGEGPRQKHREMTTSRPRTKPDILLIRAYWHKYLSKLSGLKNTRTGKEL